MSKPRLGIGMVGYAFMGAAHSHAWRSAPRFFDLPWDPELTVLCGRDRDAVAAAGRRMGWSSVETDWRAVVGRDDVDVVDVCTPGSSHAEIAVAALEAGKHVLCEKPLANSVGQARAMVAAAERAAAAGTRSMVAFNYRRVPALALARRLIGDGRLGQIRHVRAVYLQDWIVDPDFPLVWRLVAEQAGSGALGDIGSHIVDLAQHLLSDRIASVCALTETFVKERPLPRTASGLAGVGGGEQRGRVTVDDAALFLARFAGGAIATFEASRFATGRRNGMRIEINGSAGSLAFDLERLNELQLYEAAADTTGGFRRILVTEADHPWMSAWWPPGHIIGWEHTFIHEIRDFVVAVGAADDPQPSFAEGLGVQQVLEAVGASAAQGVWTSVGEQ